MNAKERLEKEFEDVRMKLDGLNSFLDSGKIRELPQIQKELLFAQKDIMVAYCNILERRLVHWVN